MFWKELLFFLMFLIVFGVFIDFIEGGSFCFGVYELIWLLERVIGVFILFLKIYY